MKDKQNRNKKIQTEIKYLKQFKKIQSNLEKILKLQNKHVFRELQSYKEKTECLRLIRQIIDDIDRIVFLMKKELRDNQNGYTNKRNKSTGQRTPNHEEKYRLLEEEKEYFFENVTVFSKLIRNDIGVSSREER